MVSRYTPKRKPRTAVSEDGFTEEERKQAWNAVQKFQSMVPQLRHFARSVSGNPKLDIKITAGVPSTRGNVISIRPPLGLGKDYRHSRAKCGTRDNDGQQLCKACQVREVIEFFLFHEIAHVAFGTQVSPNEEDQLIYTQYMSEWHPTGVCEHVTQKQYFATRSADPLNLGGVMNDYLPTIINCLEDARVNARTFDARPGLKTVFDLNIEKLMTEGVEIGVDRYERWTDVALDPQFMIGLNLLASAHEIEGRLHDSVVEALRDDELNELCARAVEAGDVHDIFALSVEVFRRAQTLGFCVVEKCKGATPQPPPEDGAEPGDGSGGSGESDAQPPAESDSDSEGDGGDSDSSVPEGDDGASSDSLGDGTSASNAERETSAARSDSTGDDADKDESATDEPDDAGSGGQHSETDDSDGDEGSQAESSGEPNENQDGDRDGEAESGSSDGRDADRAGEVDEEREAPAEVSDDDSDLEAEASAEEGPDESERTDSLAEDPWATESPDDTLLDDGGASFEAPSVDGDAPTAGDLHPGTADDVARAIARFLMHGVDGYDGMLDAMADGDVSGVVGLPDDENEELPHHIRELIMVALAQTVYFDDSSMYVAGIDEVRWPNRKLRWEPYHLWRDFAVPESLVGQAIMQARRVFDDNKRGKHLTNLKSGTINTRVLGRRAPTGDPRLFAKKVLPGKKSYFVAIGGDCSGSTDFFERNQKIKRAIMAQGDLLTRLGVGWAGYMHTAHTAPSEKFQAAGRPDSYYVYILPFKKANEAWNDDAKTKLANVMPVSENLDGHTLEYYRKVVERSTATDKIIIYYTDGAMPAANYDEEREVLEREIRYCKTHNITLLGVGINTDSPKQYGMETVRIDSDEDIIKVVEALERLLIAKERM